ncbi:YraN family protein [Leucobacter insecticola]|uniref:UPF0102 protein G7067_10790 n=1 Tax=Leucobacter insecticola TaxID=2714934 RepID=A0A6G8FK94_9MICO|nr:YraN family protein [Leucobacter insecticola]QIM16781.1 YraN family protein [Leucobacter insecticola]
MTSTTAVPHREPHNQTLGAYGESLAAEYLTGLGFHILERNWRTRAGELDLIARDRQTLVAIEVKTRSGTGYGNPLEAITAQKMLRLRHLLLDWAHETRAHGHGLRVDAVGITLRANQTPRIDHLRGIS